MVKILNVICLIVLVLFFCRCDEAKKPEKKTKKEIKKEVAVKKEPKVSTQKLKAKHEETAENSMTPDQINLAKEILASVSKSDIEKLDGKKLFRTHCAICHGFKGNMKINGAKDLTKSKLPQEEAVAQMYFGKGLMTPYKDILNKSEIVALSQFITTLRK
jgi:mono/diheme cytochrome c family protein